jgi:hypothetical protein
MHIDCCNVWWWLFAHLSVKELAEVLAFDFNTRRDAEAKSKLALGGSRGSSDVGMLKLGHDSQGR